MAALGAGEIIFNSIDRDGVMNGYDLDAAMRLRHSVNLPITILGGAGGLNHIRELFDQCGVVGASAGSLFVFKGPYRAVLITYPSIEQKDALFNV
jgi:cyclase